MVLSTPSFRRLALASTCFEHCSWTSSPRATTRGALRHIRHLLPDLPPFDAIYDNRFSVVLILETKMQRTGSSLAAPPRRVKCTVSPHEAEFYIHPSAQTGCSHIASAPPTPPSLSCPSHGDDCSARLRSKRFRCDLVFDA